MIMLASRKHTSSSDTLLCQWVELASCINHAVSPPLACFLSSHSLQNVLLLASGWRHVPILVVGDLMLDQYVRGEVDRISPEAPAPVVRATTRDEKPAGAANVAMNLASPGVAGVVGFAGRDREQSTLEALLIRSGHSHSPQFVRLVAAPTTITKLRILSGHQHIIRLDTESRTAFATHDPRRLLNCALGAVEGCCCRLCSPITPRER